MKFPKWLKPEPIKLPWNCVHCGMDFGWHIVDNVRGRSESYCPYCGGMVTFNFRTTAIKENQI